jgi:uncharacterized membrane protein
MRLQSKVTLLIGIWCALILFTPLIAHLFPVASIYLYMMFSPLCHQIPGRSFFLSGIQLPVCARCTGIYLGGFVGSFFVRPRAPPPWILMAAFLPMGIDGVTQIFFRESTNSIRFLTGFIAGVAVLFYLYPGILSLKLKR